MDDEKADTKPMSDEEVLSRAKQLLTLTDLVDRYPDVVARRVNGMVFVLIGGGISLGGLIFTTLMSYIEATGLGLLGILLFVLMNLIIAWAIAFRLIIPLAKSYGPASEDASMSTVLKVTWAILTPAIVIASLYTFGTNQETLFAPIMQTLLFFGMLANYYEARRDSEQAPFASSHLIFALLIGLSIVPAYLFQGIAFTIMIAVDIGGLYGMGVYMLLSAERILVETMGRD